jgi:hypothetical protein
MQKYIDQLVDDLNETAQSLPNLPYIEIPDQFKELEDLAELATSPFKTIEELTGISKELFPPMIQLDADQCKQVNRAIFKIYDALRLQPTDIPPNYPEELLYDLLTSHWQYPVQYLPSSGMDLEFCTGEAETCPYVGYCDCGEPFEEYDIPDRFHQLIPRIAQSIDAGFICYLDKETLELDEIPKSLLDDPLEFEMSTGIGMEDYEMKYQDWDRYFKFEPLESYDSFKIMEAFASVIEDEKLQSKLFYALNHKKPFANFKWKIDNSLHRQNWFDFKQEWLEGHIKKEIYCELNETTAKEETDGFFEDDGTIVNPEAVPIPSLCILCRKYKTHDHEENLLCLMTRYDQRDSNDFNCDAFEKI